MKKIKAQRTVDVALFEIRKAILEGTFPVGSMLPPERKLAELLSINRQTLRTALARLESEYLLKAHHGKGIVVLDYRKRGSIELMSYISKEESLKELFALRRNLAAEAAAIACEKATIHDLNQLRSLAQKQSEEEDSYAFLLGDLEFTKTMIDASKSLPLRLLFNSIERITLAQSELPIKSLSNKEAAVSSYMALIALIRHRNPLLCRKAILNHSALSAEENAELHFALSKEQ